MRQYKRLIDAATERGIEQEWVNRKGLKPYTSRIWATEDTSDSTVLIVWLGVEH